MNVEILSRLTFPAFAAAASTITSSCVVLIRVRLCFNPYTILSLSSQKPKMCFDGILKENVPLTVGDWVPYACLTANTLLSALAAVVAVFFYHSWDPEPLKSHLGILTEQTW